MPEDPNSAAQNDEQDFALPGQDDGDGGGGGGDSAGGPPAPQAFPAGPQGSPGAQTSPQQAASPPQGTPAQEADTNAAESAPKISGRAMFLGGLLKTILSGAIAGAGASGTRMGNEVKAGSQAAPEQQLQQAKISTAMSDADQAKAQASITGMKALQTEYLLKRLPADDQMRHLETVSNFKQALIKEGADVVAEGDDEKASDAQAFHLNGTDPRATSHAGKFYSLPTIDSDGKPKFDTVYVPSKEVLQNDYKYTDSNGKEQTIPAGTPMAGAMGKFVENLQKSVQQDTKDQHKQMADALKPNVPDAVANQTIGWLQAQQKENTPLYQQNKNAVDAQINTLKAAHGQNLGEAIAKKNAGIASQNLLSPEAVDQAAEKYSQTGQLASGLSRSPTTTAAIIKRAAELHPDQNLAENEGAFKSNQASLTKLQTTFDNVSAFENTAGKNLDVFLKQAKTIADSGSPWINKPLRDVDKNVLGSEDMAAFNAARVTAVTEIGKVLNSANASGVLSDSARQEVSELIGKDATFKQITKAAGILKQDMANRHESYRLQIQDIQQRMGSKAAPSGETKPAATKGGDAFAQFGGKMRTQ